MTIRVGRKRKKFLVHKKLICNQSPYFSSIYNTLSPGGDPVTETHITKYTQAFELLVDYLYRGSVPTGPQPPKPLAKSSAEEIAEVNKHDRLIRELCSLAEKFGINDLANRALDELQNSNSRCEWRLNSRDIMAIYKNTCSGSKLRWYAACSTAFFLTDGPTGDGARDRFERIFGLRRAIPDLFPDVVRAHFENLHVLFDHAADPRERVEERGFGPCEFHVHDPGETCHSTGVTASEEVVKSSAEPESEEGSVYEETESRDVGDDFEDSEMELVEGEVVENEWRDEEESDQHGEDEPIDENDRLVGNPHSKADHQIALEEEDEDIFVKDDAPIGAPASSMGDNASMEVYASPVSDDDNNSFIQGLFEDSGVFGDVQDKPHNLADTRSSSKRPIVIIDQTVPQSVSRRSSKRLNPDVKANSGIRVDARRLSKRLNPDLESHSSIRDGSRRSSKRLKREDKKTPGLGEVHSSRKRTSSSTDREPVVVLPGFSPWKYAQG